MIASRMQGIAVWKKIAVSCALVVCGIAISSLVFNFPLPFRAKRPLVPKSQSARHPSTTKPDHIVLTPTQDMKTMARISWRTSAPIQDGVVQFAEKGGEGGKNRREVRAEGTALHSPELTEDNTVSLFSALLENLSPGTVYRYRVGSRKEEVWSEYGTFATEPATEEPFSFVYFGDTQVRPKGFGSMLASVERRHPETAFYMIGGDLVDVGDYRNLWDDLLASTGTVFMRTPVMPAMGNHDFGEHGIGPGIFSSYFGFPGRDDTVDNFSFHYGNAFFAVVNSLDVSDQTAWLERELRQADSEGYAFKIVMFHVPVYHPKKHRRNAAAERQWVPLFDKYRVDLVLTGHDHSYLRSKPLRSGRPVAEGEFGTTYVVATACDKFYQFEELAIAERQFANTTTYQLVELSVSSDGRPLLRYSARDEGGMVVDTFEDVKH